MAYKLTQFFAGCADSYAEFRSKLDRLLAKITDSKPIQLLIEYRRPVAFFLYLLWIVGFGYWFYQLMIIDVTPKSDLGLRLTDSRDAMTILFFGSIGLVFVAFFVFFVIKLIYNLFHDGIESLFQGQWHLLAKPLSYLVILYFAFSFTGTIKMAGLTAYNQVAEIVHTSRQQDFIIKREVPDDLEEKLNKLLKLAEEDKKE